MGKKKGRRKLPENPEGSAQTSEQQQNSGPSGLEGSQNLTSQQQAGVQEPARAPGDGQPLRQGHHEEQGLGSLGQRQYRDQRQAPVASQSSTAMQQPASAWSKVPELPASEQGKNSEPAAKQSTSALNEIPELFTQRSTPARPSSASSAETKIKGKGRSGGQSSESAGTTTSLLSEQSTPVETELGKKKQKGQCQENQKPTPSAAPSPSTSGGGGIVTNMEKLTLKTKPEASAAAQLTASAQPSTDKSAETKKKGKGKSGAQLPQQTVTSTVPEEASVKSSETKAGGKKTKGKGQKIQKVADSTTSLPSTQRVGDTRAKTEKTKFIIPKRTGPICDGIHAKIIHDREHVKNTLTIEVNYLPLKITKPQLKIFHYDVNFAPIPRDENFAPVPRDVNFVRIMPKSLLRDAVEKMRLQHFPNRYPAFDGRSNMYIAGSPLNRDTVRDTVTVSNGETGRDREFDVTIKLVSSNLTVANLLEYCQKGITSNAPQTEIQATDIALRSGLTDFTPAGRSFFRKPSSPTSLGDGLELWDGFYQSAVAAWKPYLNIDVANKAFPVEQSVMDYLKKYLMLSENTLLQNGLEHRDRKRLEKFIRGLKISYEMPVPEKKSQKRSYKVIGLGGNCMEERSGSKVNRVPIKLLNPYFLYQYDVHPPSPATPWHHPHFYVHWYTQSPFEHENGRISVDDYYRTVKQRGITYKKLPLLKCGTRELMVPIELCSIIGNQTILRKLDENQTSEMVKAAAKPTFVRKNRIEQNIQAVGYACNPTLKEFGIEVQTKFESVDAVVISPPKIAYSKVEVPVIKGVWALNSTFRQPSVMPSWGILNLNRLTDLLPKLENLMIRVGSELGMNISRPRHHIEHNEFIITDDQIDEYLRIFMMKNIHLVVVVLANSNENYGQVKRASELRVGVLTQCLKLKTLRKINSMTVKNILLKVNSKLKGVNHRLALNWTPAFLTKPFMLVGADVTHPAPGPEAKNTPSIAAVAASQEICGFQYDMQYRLQNSRQEMITDLADMMKEHLESFRKKHKRLPENIFYFRDGVSEGQFQEVLETELTAIKRACALVTPGYEAKVLFLVVQKRHHTRFFPKREDGDTNGNVPAGTLVDHKITHPTELDFFLVSHQSIQGTARPTKYHLLFDDIDYSTFANVKNPQFELEKLTYYLCHMFSRCTRSVSYPAPTYYAHLAAFRARAWWDRMSLNMARLQEEQKQKGTINANITTNYPMFFT